MIFLGMWTCQVRELQPMMFGAGGGKAKATPALPPSLENEDGEESGREGIFYRMLGRGRRKTNGSAEYEMVGMAHRESAV